MNLIQRREEPGKLPAGILAVLVHLLFIGLLVFGVSWQNKPPAAVTAELWSSLPPAPKASNKPAPKVIEPPKEAPKPEPKPEPKPKEEPKVQAKPPVEKPDIQLKDKELKRQKEEKEKQEEQKRKLEKEKLEKEKQQKQQLQEQQAKQAEQQRVQNEQAAAYQAAQAGVQSKISDYKDRIQSKIKRFINVPLDIQGNPQAEFDVVLLPSGDLLSVKLKRSSGNSGYDSAVERAIYKAQPLPLPPDISLFKAFRELSLKFRPQEGN